MCIARCVNAYCKKGNRDKSAIEEEQLLHRDKVKLARDKMFTSNTLDDSWVVVAKVQPTMPVPKLAVGTAYYIRKLWLYNFCVHDLKENVSYKYL